MRRKLIALAVAGLATPPVFAQGSYVQIYGQLEASYINWTHDHTGTTFQSPMGNGIGFTGEEDLGSGTKAFFKLEERFNIDDGSGKDLRWNEISFVGLKGGFGEAIFGRVWTIMDTIYPDPGSGDTVGSGLERKAFGATRAINAIRYTSPALGPVQLIAHYGLSERVGGTATTAGQSNINVYGVAATANFGPARVDLGWQRDADFYKRWAVYGAYDFGVVSLGLGHARAKNFIASGSEASAIGVFSIADGPDVNSTADAVSCAGITCKAATTYFGGFVPVPSGKIGFVVNRVSSKIDDDKIKAYMRYGVSYWHDLSKRTQLVASVAYDHQKAETETLSNGDVLSTGFDGHDSRVGLQVGLRHKF